MSKKIAASLALVVFAVCLFIGGVQADNTFSTAVTRALLAMAVTLVVGLVIGMACQKMLEENLRSEKEKLEKATKVDVSDR